MDASQWQAQQFEEHRNHLRSVARRILGSAAEAEDAVQETWLRLSAADTSDVANMRGWLTTVTSRICLDALRARTARREELADGAYPEAVVPFDQPDDPEGEALLADSVGLALLVVLETLSPAERLAFVLHDMFGMSFQEISPIVDRNVAATRQLASRARRRVRGAPVPDAGSLAAQRRVVEAFLAASREGDFAGLVELLDPQVVFRGDGGDRGPRVPVEVTGARDVAALVLERGTPFAPLGRPAIVGGRPGAMVAYRGQVLSVVTFTISGGRITEMHVVTDPARLRAIRL